MRKALWLVVIAFGLTLAVSPAKADQLSAGGSGAPDAFLLGFSYCPGSTGAPPCGAPRTEVGPIPANQNNPFPTIVSWGSGTFTGQVAEEVDSDPSNVFCAGCLDFIFQIENNSPGALPPTITGLSEAGFSGYLTDVGYDTFPVGYACGPNDFGFCSSGGAGTVPGTVSRSADGDTVTFSGLNVKGVDASVDLVIETNATTFTDPLMTITGSNGGTAQISVYGPTPLGSGGGTNMPEPSSLLLLGTGLLGVMGMTVLRKRPA